MLRIRGIGSFYKEADVKAMGDCLQTLADEAVGAGEVEIFYDCLEWYIKGGTDEQQLKALRKIKSQGAIMITALKKLYAFRRQQNLEYIDPFVIFGTTRAEVMGDNVKPDIVI